jgi:flavin-dependent dehydrogenase
MEQQYAVIIIGGRIAGASLAIRLGQQQLPVRVRRLPRGQHTMLIQADVPEAA